MAEKLQFLYRIQPTRADMLKTGPTPKEESILSKHFHYLKDLKNRGVVLLAGRTLKADEKAFGIVILEADSEKSARDIMLEDPAVSGGVMRAELFPFRVALRK